MSTQTAIMRPNGRLMLGTFSILTIFGLTALLAAIFMKPDEVCILLPCLAIMAAFLLFSQYLKILVGDNLFGEIGFLFAVFIVVYTVFPGITFLFLNMDLASGWVWQNLSKLLPAPQALGVHLWRHVLYMIGFGAGYLMLRGRKSPILRYQEDGQNYNDSLLILVILFIVLVCVFAMNAMSAPVTTYIDNYTRYDHLSWWPRKFLSLCIRMKQGFYVALLVFLFAAYKKYKYFTLFSVFSMVVFEVLYSFGSRIEALIVLLMALCLYHYSVQKVTLKKGLIACLAIALAFSVMEVSRAYNFSFADTKSSVSEYGFQPASEFGAVYFTGFHMYEERAQNAIPPKEWPMFFFDFISLVVPNDDTRWSPQYWYAKVYFPDAVVPPETMGPIADSAIWGGEIDLFLRSLINGIFFAYMIRWFISRADKWWGVAVYVFCFATCVLTLKYSVFYHLNPLFKTFLPVLVLIAFARKRFFLRRHTSESKV